MTGVFNSGSGWSASPMSLVRKDEGALVQQLKVLLADQVTFYLRAHGFHWNVKGQDFAQYHELFQEIYEDTYSAVDPIAELLLKLQSDAPFRLPEYLALRTIQDAPVIDDPAAMAADLLAANDRLLATLRLAAALASAADEQGVLNFLAERIDMGQKWAWQLRASLGQPTA